MEGNAQSLRNEVEDVCQKFRDSQIELSRERQENSKLQAQVIDFYQAL